MRGYVAVFLRLGGHSECIFCRICSLVVVNLYSASDVIDTYGIMLKLLAQNPERAINATKQHKQPNASASSSSRSAATFHFPDVISSNQNPCFIGPVYHLQASFAFKALSCFILCHILFVYLVKSAAIVFLSSGSCREPFQIVNFLFIMSHFTG